MKIQRVNLIRSRKSRKERRYNDRHNTEKHTNNSPQTLHGKQRFSNMIPTTNLRSAQVLGNCMLLCPSCSTRSATRVKNTLISRERGKK